MENIFLCVHKLNSLGLYFLQLLQFYHLSSAVRASIQCHSSFMSYVFLCFVSLTHSCVVLSLLFILLISFTYYRNSPDLVYCLCLFFYRHEISIPLQYSRFYFWFLSQLIIINMVSSFVCSTFNLLDFLDNSFHPDYGERYKL